jgi:glycine dehydrogenase subunit 2
MAEPTIFEYSHAGRAAFTLPEFEGASVTLPAALMRTAALTLPEVSELDLVRHYVKLSQQNHAVDTGFYPLGSCTMKYNPKINEAIAALPGIANAHPLQQDADVQGMLELLYNCEQYLCALFGYERFTLQPVAGAHGELTGLQIMRAYHLSRKDTARKKVIVPDSSHGTNPATATAVGFETIVIPSNKDGNVDLEALKKVLGSDTAGLMLTNPNTVGLFDENIKEISDLVHAAGGLVYYDGANANATLGIVRPGDMGFDICHLNLHKTFSTPHGGGGPGSGPVGVKKELVQFLPKPLINKQGDKFVLYSDMPLSIGKVHSFYGNVGVVVRAYCYIRMMGAEGLRRASEDAILNANYLMSRLRDDYEMAYPRYCKHEFVISAKNFKRDHNIKALDIAKRLIDYGFHPPTIYFPLIVSECLMIEPTETESKETLDLFADVMIKIAKEAKEHPELLHDAPHNTPVRRLDEVKAVKEPCLCYCEG